MSTPYVWVESTSWELPFFGLPSRIPWPADADPQLASANPFDQEELLRAIDLMGADAGSPWQEYRQAAEHFDALAEALEDHEFPDAARLLDQMEGIHPGSAFVAFHRGIVARHDGRFDEAITHFEAAAQKTPKVGMIWLQLGSLLAQEGQRDKAVAALNHAVQCNPQDRTAFEMLASLKAAVKVLRDPKDENSAVYLNLGQYAQLCSQQLQEIKDQPAALIDFAEFQLRNEFAGDLAVQALERARELQPKDPRTLAALSNAYRVVGRHAEAKPVAEALTENFPNEPQAWFNLAAILNAGGQPAEEKVALEKVLALDPEVQPALAMLSGLNQGPSVDAETYLLEFGEKTKAATPFLLASVSARDRRETALAVDYAAKAFAIAPEREDILLHYCTTLGDAKDAAGLFRDIEPALQSGKFSKRLDWQFAHALKQLGRVQEAVNVLIHAGSGEGVPEDFQHAAVSTIDLWTGRLAQSDVTLNVSKGQTITRPVVLSIDGEDGAVVLQAGQAIPAETRFPWRVRLDASGETRITLQQGQRGGAVEPHALGAFAVKVPPVTGGAHTLQCLLGTGPDARLLFKAVQGNKELPVRWVAPEHAAI